MRKHGSSNGVADGIHGRHGGLEALVDRYTATLVQLQADVFQTEVLRVRTATDGHQQHVAVELNDVEMS